MLWNKWILRCLIIFNTFYWITGCITLSVGIYEITYSDYHFLRGKYDLGLFTGSYMICSCGIFILISSPFGWAGILSRSRGISISFCIILVLNGICLLSCGIWSSKYSENIHFELNEMFDNLLKNYDEKRLMVNDETKLLNYIQYKGCLTKVIGTTKSGQFRIAFVSICIAMWQFFGIIIYSFFTCSNWNHQSHHHHHHQFDYQYSKKENPRNFK
ncbi:unnamed protein product [Schistosoma margrebowiei]|uniref:Tetraspanin n=1 Tax=Schistosoma margrebowiei TaxID=48269 RepID=A0AA84ZZ20_9TREM|nr:unnamed protein product [Schistosoma margrebowiei]